MNRELTVAAVRGSEEADHVEVLFLESSRIYVLERARPNFHELLDRLREGVRVEVTFAQQDSDVIEDVQPSSILP